MKTHFQDANDLLNFTLTITPDEGAYLSYFRCDTGAYLSWVQACTRVARSTSLSRLTTTTPTSHQRSSAYRPCVKTSFCVYRLFLTCRQIYHPNVDLEGNVCLNILREDWKPVLNLNSVMVGLQYLFLEPNADDPLNKGTWLS